MNVDSVRGLTAMGQRLLLLIGHIIALALAVFPAAAVFLPSLWLVRKLLMAGHPIAILLATIPAAAILVAEIFVAHKSWPQ